MWGKLLVYFGLTVFLTLMQNFVVVRLIGWYVMMCYLHAYRWIQWHHYWTLKLRSAVPKQLPPFSEVSNGTVPCSRYKPSYMSVYRSFAAEALIFWDATQSGSVVVYCSFGTACLSHDHGSSNFERSALTPTHRPVPWILLLLSAPWLWDR